MIDAYEIRINKCLNYDKSSSQIYRICNFVTFMKTQVKVIFSTFPNSNVYSNLYTILGNFFILFSSTAILMGLFLPSRFPVCCWNYDYFFSFLFFCSNKNSYFSVCNMSNFETLKDLKTANLTRLKQTKLQNRCLIKIHFT